MRILKAASARTLSAVLRSVCSCVLVLPLASCTSSSSHRAETNLQTPADRQVGSASWYGRDFHGRETANGETYDMHDMTAAHRTLPFGTRVRVTNLRSGKSVIVRINDRGPFAKGRVIDLSAKAARRLGFKEAGLAKVELKVLHPRTFVARR